MTDRVLPALRLERDPLFLVLAQVRIAPVLEIGRFIPPMQEQFRRSGFPHYNEIVTQEVSVSPPAQVSTRQRTHWLFMDETEKRSITVTPDSIVLETADYDVFDTFIEQFEMVLGVVDSEADVAYANRLGLRYVNRIEPVGSLELNDMVLPGLLDLSEDMLDVRSMLSRFEWRSVTDHGRLVIRLTKVDDQSVLPTDLEQTSLDIRKPTPGVFALVLDTDHYTEGKRDFEAGSVVDAMWQLHGHTDRTFRTVVTEEALQAWGVQER